MKAEAAMQSRDSCQQARGHAMWQTGPHRVGLGPTPMWQMDHTGLLSRGHDSRRSLRGHMSQCATQTQRPLLWLKKKTPLPCVHTSDIPRDQDHIRGPNNTARNLFLRDKVERACFLSS